MTACVRRGIMRRLLQTQACTRQSPASAGRCSCPASAQETQACTRGHDKVATADGAFNPEVAFAGGENEPSGFLSSFSGIDKAMQREEREAAQRMARGTSFGRAAKSGVKTP